MGAFLADGLFFQPIFLVAPSLAPAAAIVYSVVLHTLWGQTLGKMLFGIEVVQMDESKLQSNHALMRDLPAIAFQLYSLAIDRIDGDPTSNLQVATSIAFLVWIVVQLVTITLNKRGRAIHDFLAGTVVRRVWNPLRP